MGNKLKKYWWVIILIIISFYIGKSNGDPNKGFIYGETGLPRNCRAIITENIQGWNSGIYTAEESLGSIDRNCGAEGYSWGLR